MLRIKPVHEEMAYLQETQMIGAMLGGSLHMLFIFLFALWEVKVLMWFNVIISVPAFFTAYWLSSKGSLKAPPWIGTIEVVLHQVLAVLLMGQDTLFHLLLFCLVPVGILFLKWKVMFFINSVLALILFLAVIWYDTGQFVMYEFSAGTLKLIRSVNSIGFFTIVGVIIYYYITMNASLHFKQKAAGEKLILTNAELSRAIDVVNEQKERIRQQMDEISLTLKNLEHTQQQLIESEKMAALGGLVAGVAHEINTPVGIGVTAISNLQEEIDRIAALFEKDKINRKDFGEFLSSAHDSGELIRKNLERTASLIQSFKLVSADQASEKQRIFNFKDYLEDIIRSLYPRFKRKKISFSIECEPDLELNSYPGAYAQVFTNLLINSITHGFHNRENGIISIRAEKHGDMLRIDYRDNGTGIGKDELPHIFEPFFTRDQSRGTGLGLNIVYNILRQKLHGSIACESRPGDGVLFRMELPTGN